MKTKKLMWKESPSGEIYHYGYYQKDGSFFCEITIAKDGKKWILYTHGVGIYFRKLTTAKKVGLLIYNR